jgi:hypothetical protein
LVETLHWSATILARASHALVRPEELCTRQSRIAHRPQFKAIIRSLQR